MNILKNAIRTPDGTVLVSRHRHDYQSYTDANGKEYMVDGGLAYCRTTVHEDQEWVGLHSDEPHDKIRNEFEWGTYGPDGTDPLSYIVLKDMETEHILNCLELRLLPQIEKAFRDELMWRERGE